MGFERIEGQARAVELLERALASGRVAHAYAFLGPAGSGRRTTALAFAQALLCRDRGCGRCQACALVTAQRHPDLHVIAPTPPDSNPKGPRAIRIAVIRELERQAALRPVIAPRKIFVLDDAELMTGEAPQAFLKTLEEPPDRTVMILVLPRAGAVPPTVLSRCHIVRFAPRHDDGGERLAEALELMREVRAKGVDALLRRSQSIDRDRAERLVDGYALLYRDLLVARAGVPTALLRAGAHAEEIRREAGSWSDDEILEGVETCRRARRALAVNVTPRLTIEVILSRLALRAA